MLLLGTMRAEERLAAFLLNLVQRLQARGFSRSELVLRMTRQEIGSYLGLKLETVSRTFSRFAEENMIEVHQRHVRIVDVDPMTLDYDAGSLDTVVTTRVAAVVGAHLFSRSCDAGRLVERFRGVDPEIRIIEDCAQTWPAFDASHADVALLSFGRGKPIVRVARSFRSGSGSR